MHYNYKYMVPWYHLKYCTTQNFISTKFHYHKLKVFGAYILGYYTTMAQNLNQFTPFLVFIFLFALIFFKTEARPLKDSKPKSNYMGQVLENIIDDIYIGTIKSSGGPSQGGKGHHFLTLGEIKNSGPSPRGKGHDYTNAENLGDMKNSGPAAGGKGHGFENSGTFGDIKNSGPAAGGKGHGFTNADILGEIKNSGPSPGGKGH